MTTPTPIPTADLPATVRAYLSAHADRDADTAIASFAPDAVVVDEGHTFRGTAEVLEFLRTAGGQFTYTTELVGAERGDDSHWVARVRIEGDFPGGTADLAYRFTLAADGLIVELLIAP
jgi:ketosteroid isomerase-like protein